MRDIMYLFWDKLLFLDRRMKMIKRYLDNLIEIISYVFLAFTTWFFSYSIVAEGIKGNGSIEIMESKYLITFGIMFISAFFYYKSKPEEVVKEMIKCTLISSFMTAFHMFYFKDIDKDAVTSDVGVIISQLLIQIPIWIVIRFLANSLKLNGKTASIIELICIILFLLAGCFINNTIIILSGFILFCIIDLIVGYIIYKNYEKKTISYFNSNANTINQNPRIINKCIDEFLSRIVKNGKILDFGAGTGDDCKYFNDKGFRVDAVDGSSEMCRIIKDKVSIEVEEIPFTKFNTAKKYKGIWANQSLCHIRGYDIKKVIKQLYNALDNDGILYCSFKHGKKDEFVDGLYYCKEYSKKELTVLFSSYDDEKKIIIENDVIYVLLRKKSKKK